MGLEFLTVGVNWRVKDDHYEAFGNANREGQEEIVSNFLRSQMGAGKDERTPQEHDVYSIRLEWHPEDDRIESYSNTGNFSLRDGILIGFLRYLGKQPSD
ncbi:hypothetical protein J4416_01430 [Candidatus Pacearchaeota archaeon]|nr:hypothetical protein [Candidatus Pacearchaeota archaeon]